MQELLSGADADGIQFAFAITHVQRLAQALEALREAAFDAILLDLSLPDSQGLDTVHSVLTAVPETPVLIMSGLQDRDVAQASVEAGAQDYLVKDYLNEFFLPRAIQYAMEHKRKEQALQRRRQELELLNRASRAFLSTLDMGQIMDQVLQDVRRLLSVTACSVWFVDPCTGELVCRHTTDPHRQILQGWRLSPGQGLAGWALQHGQTLNVGDAQTDPRYFKGIEAKTGLPLHAILSVPLSVKEQITGVVQAVDTSSERFDATDVMVMEMLAAFAGWAIETAGLYQALRVHADRLEALHQIDQAAMSARSQEEIAQAALTLILRVVPCYRASIALFDFENGVVDLLTVRSSNPTCIDQGLSFSLEAYHIPDALWQNDVHLIQDVSHEPASPVNQVLRSEGLRAYLNVPLTSPEGLIGCLHLGAAKSGFFTPEHVSVVREVATQLALAVEQTRLRDALQRHTENLEALVQERTKKLQVALQQAQEADRVKSQFISNVSHELRTPLTNLKLYLSLLSRGQPEKRDAYLETLHRETERLQKMIESLLDLSRLDLGKVQLNLQPTDLNQVVETLVTDRSALATDEGLHLQIVAKKDLPPAAADPKLVEQVLTNILTNAINYTPSGGTITLRTGTVQNNQQDWVTVSVSDTGPGIAESEQPHIFERFYRGEAGRNSSAPGTGLGLAICQEIVERHGGQITLESQAGQGSTFTVWLPAQPVHPH